MTAQELRASLLQEAVTGRLVPQRAEEGSAETLYEEIQQEKARLIAEKKLKKTKPLPSVTNEEKPFDIPDSWKWVRVGEIATVLGGKRMPAGRHLTTENTGHKYIRVSDMKEGTVLTDKLLYVPSDIYHSISRYIIRKEDVYITVAGTIGQVGKIPEEIDGANLTENADRLVFSMLNQEWLIKCLQSNVVQSQIANVTTKVGQPKLAIKRIQELILPLPPLAEQKRIVDKLEELLPLVDAYGEAEQRLAAYEARFPDALKRSLLQEAVTGRLVPQRAEEGSAEPLYEEIRQEKARLIAEKKIKKEKPLPPVTEEEQPFPIPATWKWTRLGELIILQSGTDLKPQDYNDQHQGIPYITGASSLSDTDVIVSRWTPVPRNIAQQGDVLIVCKGSVGKTVICNVPKAHIARQIMAIKKTEFLYMPFILYFLTANFTQIKSNEQGVIPGISRETILQLLFPLPPLAEQKRIVDKLEELLALAECIREARR